jgi:probable rRNA maturation factor
LPVAKIRKVLYHVIDDHKVNGKLLIVFNNNRQMQNLNLGFKGKNIPTDVLAFNLAENRSKYYIEGEVYVNLQLARYQAVEYGVSYFQEVVRLCLHGFLHLLGYDDLTADKKEKMWKVQEQYIKNYL